MGLETEIWAWRLGEGGAEEEKKKEEEKNRSPKGNMWSAIPVALL